MSLHRTLAANYLGTGVIALVPILALPWYLQALGPREFGLIGIVVLLQAILGLFDAGMSQALLREFSVRLVGKTGGNDSASSLLLGFERMYWAFALVAGLCVCGVSEWLLTHWSDLGRLPQSLGQQAVFGAAAIFASHFPGSVYRSFMVSAQQQVKLNSLMVVGSLVRHAGGAALVTAYPSITIFFVWHALTALLETLARAALAWRIAGVVRSACSWNGAQMRSVWKSVVSMSGVAWLGALTVQMDKIIVSKMVSIEQFGYYTLASTLSVGVLQLIYPLVQTTLPSAMQLRDDGRSSRRLYTKLWWQISALVGVAGLVYAFFGEWMLQIWLRNPAAIDAVYPVVSVLLMGTALNALYNVGYLHWLVQGIVKPILLVNVLALILSVTFIPTLVTQWGILGGAFGWVSMNLIGCALSLEWTKKLHHDRVS